MLRPSAALLLLGAILSSACHIEDHTPAGSRRDESFIRAVVAGHYRCLAERRWAACRTAFWPGATFSATGGGDTLTTVPRAIPVDSMIAALARTLSSTVPGDWDLRLLRSEVHQDGDLATVWADVRQHSGDGDRATDTDFTELLVLRRLGGAWRIASISLAGATPR
jgi:poly(3-hydroxybutyrate) depolymerase